MQIISEKKTSSNQEKEQNPTKKLNIYWFWVNFILLSKNISCICGSIDRLGP